MRSKAEKVGEKGKALVPLTSRKTYPSADAGRIMVIDPGPNLAADVG